MPDLQSLMNLLLSQFVALFAGSRDLVSESGVGLSSPCVHQWCLMQTHHLGLWEDLTFRKLWHIWVVSHHWHTVCVLFPWRLLWAVSEVSSVEGHPSDQICFYKLLHATGQSAERPGIPGLWSWPAAFCPLAGTCFRNRCYSSCWQGYQEHREHPVPSEAIEILKSFQKPL